MKARSSGRVTCLPAASGSAAPRRPISICLSAAAAFMGRTGRRQGRLRPSRRPKDDFATTCPASPPLHAALAALLLVGAPLLYQAGSQIRINLELQSARSQLSTVVQESSAQFDALQRYQANSARLDSYRTALDLAHPLAPATELAETAQAINGQLNRFRIVPGRIEAVLGTRTETDPADIVRALEETPSLANVEIRRARAQGDWEVQADLVTAGTLQEPES